MVWRKTAYGTVSSGTLQLPVMKKKASLKVAKSYWNTRWSLHRYGLINTSVTNAFFLLKCHFIFVISLALRQHPSEEWKAVWINTKATQARLSGNTIPGRDLEWPTSTKLTHSIKEWGRMAWNHVSWSYLGTDGVLMRGQGEVMQPFAAEHPVTNLGHPIPVTIHAFTPTGIRPNAEWEGLRLSECPTDRYSIKMGDSWQKLSVLTW